MKLKSTIPEGCVEAPGYILDVYDGVAWMTLEGRLTTRWSERGIWPTAEAAQAAKERFFGNQDTLRSNAQP